MESIKSFWKRWGIGRTVCFVIGMLIILSFMGTSGRMSAVRYYSIPTLNYYINTLSVHFSFWQVFFILGIYFIIGLELVYYGLVGSFILMRTKESWKFLLKISPTLIIGILVIAAFYRFGLGLEVYDLPPPQWLTSFGNFLEVILVKVGLLK
jgi:hypothetical protein